MEELIARAVVALVVAPLYVIGVALFAYATGITIDALARFTGRHLRRPVLWK